jgi:hypothetical protein
MIRAIPMWVLVVLFILVLGWYVGLRLDYTYNVSQARSFAKIKNDVEWALDIADHDARLKTQTILCQVALGLSGPLLLVKLLFRLSATSSNTST